MRFYLRAVFVFALLAALAVVAWQLAMTPGEVALVWHGWRIDTSASLVAAAFAAFLAIGALLYAVLHGIRILPRRLAQARERRRKEAGYHALTRGMVAIAAGDAAEAKRFAERAAQLLGRPPGVAVLLTGMRDDGARGMAALRQASWLTIAQDEASSVVFGMPRAAAERNAASRILPLSQIGGSIVARMKV